MLKNKKYIFIAASLLLFVILAVVYANPVLNGKQLFQHDIIQYKGGAKELLDFRANNGKETYWSDSMFGGMPTYQMGAQFRGDLIRSVDDFFMLLPKPANYLFLLFSGFFLLGLVVVRNWKYALLGATFFGLSTYFYIALAAGHNGKIHTVAYFAPLLAGILLVYVRKKYVFGFIVTTLFMALQIFANHPQMTYYIFLALGFLFLSEFLRAATGKISWKHFGISTGILAVAFVLGVGMNSQRIMANSEYIKETVRGKQILNNDLHTSGKSGMDKESMLMWSYGKLETLNLFIPRLMGGGSQEDGSAEMMNKTQELIQQNATSQQEVDNIQKGFSSTTYWGNQPGTSGPAYQGAVVIFLAILGFFFAWKKYRYWILGASILTIFLAWGSNFLIVSDFFIDYVPFYNKFRAPSSILVVVELLFPLLAIIGLYRFFNSNETTETSEENILTDVYKQKVLIWVSSVILGFTLLLLIFGKSLLGFHTDAEKTYFPPYLLDYFVVARYSVFKIDALKAILYVALVFAVLYFALKKKLSQNLALIIIGLISLFDLWSVNKRYLNNDNFVDKTFAEQPFQTETSDLLIEKVGDNQNLKSLLDNAKVNKALETISEKDKAHYRIFNNILGTFSETNTSYYKSSVGGYHAVKLRRYDDLINAYFSTLDSIKTPKILNLLDVKYMVLGNQENPQIVPNPENNGNAWFVSDVKFVKTPNEELNSLGEIDSKKTAVISDLDKNYFNGKNLAKDSTAIINLTKYQANSLEYKTQSKTPQLAVFSEIYYPEGWKMFIDDVEVPYIKADYLLRAVSIPAGNHTIQMVFEPKVIATGKIVSLISLLLFLIFSGFGIYFLYRKHNDNLVTNERYISTN
ncbi:YfhO family protein [Halpernia sp.]|uniref:YfhO family protein n=1 Tax=Halpernia sp. TaxID=2782209 RepID=UPI003A8E7B7E